MSALYAQAVHGPFIYDDVTAIQQNPALASWHSVGKFFVSAVALSNDYRGYAGSIYRPLTWLSFLVERKLWGLNPLPFHLFNLTLHWINGVLGFLLLRKLGMAALLSAVASLVWLGLPINAETVAWISGRHTCLAACFILLALLAAACYFRSRAALPLVAYFFAALAALLSNEWGFLVFPLTLLVAYAALGTSWRRVWPLCGAAVLASMAYFALRQSAGAHLPIGAPAITPVGLSFFKYLGWMLLPLRMSVERSTDTPTNTFSIAAVLAIALLALLIVAVFVFRKRLPQVAAGLAWLVLALLPFCGVVFIYQGMAERYTYLASQGLTFAIVALAFRAKHTMRPLAFLLLVVWVAWGTWRLHVRGADWQNEERLFQTSLQATPDSAILLYNLGIDAASRGNSDQAIRYYGRALRQNPNYLPAILNLGNALRSQSDFSTASALYRRAMSLDPKSPDPWVNLGDVYFETGSIPQAMTAYRKALALKPDDVQAIINMGAAFQKSGDLLAARQHYERALALDPTQAGAYCDLGILLLQQGDTDGAAKQFTLAIQQDSHYAAAYFDLGVLFQTTSDRDMAIRMYRKALVLKPDYASARRNLAALTQSSK